MTKISQTDDVLIRLESGAQTWVFNDDNAPRNTPRVQQQKCSFMLSYNYIFVHGF